MLGLDPDEFWDIGMAFRAGKKEKIRDSSSWAVVERAVGNEECSAAADRLLGRLQALIPQFQALPSGVEVSLRILVNEDNDVFGLGLDRAHVQFAAAIRADIDISIVAWIRPPDGS